MISGLLIHLTGGRIETHFHIFGSLAFLAFYRDWRVLITATVVTAADHFVRGIFWPQSVFGVLTASPWRPVEHAAWVIFEDIFLIISCVQDTQEMGSIARRQVKVETANQDLQSLVHRVRKASVSLMSTATAIEAEKAGEYGLGFLVMAREIRRLADQTSVATLDIERLVKDMQSSVAVGVMEMDKFRDQVRHGVNEAGHVRDRLGQIIAAVRGLSERFGQVTEGMRAQTQGADQIREAVIHLSQGAHQTSTSLREFNLATDHMREAVGELKDEVSRVRLETAGPGQPLQAV